MSVPLILAFMPLKTGSATSKLILLKMADNADARGVCFPSSEYLAQYCEVSLRTVKRHLIALEQQGFIRRVKRFDERGRQRSILYQLRMPEGMHMEQSDIESESNKTPHFKKEEWSQSDTHQGDRVTSTEGDTVAHITCHLEHKTGESDVNKVSAPEKTGHAKQRTLALSESDSASSKATSTATPTASKQDRTTEASSKPIMALLASEGNAPIYPEFYHILKQSYPELDVLQELHAMQAWLYINPDKRKPIEHIGHFVNGWLRRSRQAKTNHARLRSANKVKSNPRSERKPRRNDSTSSGEASRFDANHHRDLLESSKPKGMLNIVSKALAEYEQDAAPNPYQARIQALIETKEKLEARG
ncbi:helix-turn-helix domain-containing protein [Vibrio maerlii]|uniref:helix-turn-helix domain-containing protein n=1 Tax=Vibrio maerlii TaxID=2231648 RepID=UPI000E3C2B69|nr:helix-turn-helix domain-containing protein [Vibrio maerlii]